MFRQCAKFWSRRVLFAAVLAIIAAAACGQQSAIPVDWAAVPSPGDAGPTSPPTGCSCVDSSGRSVIRAWRVLCVCVCFVFSLGFERVWRGACAQDDAGAQRVCGDCFTASITCWGRCRRKNRRKYSLLHRNDALLRVAAVPTTGS